MAEKTIQENIKLLRKMRGIKQCDLAKSVDISRSYLSLIERVKRKPPCELVEKILEKLDCKLVITIK